MMHKNCSHHHVVIKRQSALSLQFARSCSYVKPDVGSMVSPNDTKHDNLHGKTMATMADEGVSDQPGEQDFCLWTHMVQHDAKEYEINGIFEMV
eukprot:scaffold1713_cov71-Cylindrotheca_fusiformis.AAC.1